MSHNKKDLAAVVADENSSPKSVATSNKTKTSSILKRKLAKKGNNKKVNQLDAALEATSTAGRIDSEEGT